MSNVESFEQILRDSRCFSEEGKCYSFDSRGSGYGRGEGAAMVALKRLDDAIRDGNPIRAIIRNSGVKQDGRTKGIMVPNSEAQKSLIESVYREAKLDPKDTLVVEAHGTGTMVGDPLEVAAIQNAFRNPGETHQSLYLGSIKPNIGHLESASGIAGLIKGVLMLEYGKVPATIGIESLKPNLHLDEFGIVIPRELLDWPSNGTRRLSLNNFGYGGTNAHAILEAPSEDLQSKLQNGVSKAISNGVPNGVHDVSVNGTHSKYPAEPSDRGSLQLVALSAESTHSISRLAQEIRDWASAQPESKDVFEDLAFTLTSRRSPMRYRIALPAHSLQDVVARLSTGSITPNNSSPSPHLIFVFTGQGAQWYAMGRELMSIVAPFRTSLQRSDEILRGLGTEWSLISELSREEDASRIHESEISQSATCAIQIALVDLLGELGVIPHTVVGHSSGEIAAAYAAGAVDQASALAIAWFRGKCTQHETMRKGAMLAVGLGEAEARPYLDVAKNGRAVIACANSPSSSTISGDVDAVADIEAAFKSDGIFVRRLLVDKAYHSHHMQEVADRYYEDIRGLKLGAPRKGTSFISSVTGEQISTAFTPQYWIDNLVSKVRFADATHKAILANAPDSSRLMMVEIGPHRALAGPVRQTIASIPVEVKASQHTALVRGQDSLETFANLAAELFVGGCSVELDRLNSILKPNRHPKVLTSLPSYPWDHSTRYWHESRLSKEHRFRRHPYHDLLGLQIPGQSSSRPVWRHVLSLQRLPWLSEHVIDGEIIFPASGYIAMVLEAMRQLVKDSAQPKKTSKYELKDIFFVSPLVIPESGTPVEIQLQLIPVEGSQWEDFRIYGYDADGTTAEHCRGSTMIILEPGADEVEGSRELDFTQASALSDLESAKSLSLDEIDATTFYRDLRARGNVYGPHFACMKEINVNAEQAISKFQVPDVAECMPGGSMRPHVIHPAVIDAFLHPSVALADSVHASKSMVTASIRSFKISSAVQNAPGTTFESCTRLTDQWAQTSSADIDVFQFDAENSPEPVVQIEGLHLQALGTSKQDSSNVSRLDNYLIKWGLDVDYVTRTDIDPYSEETDDVTVTQAHKLHTLNLASAVYIDQFLKRLEKIGSMPIQENFQRMVGWMQRFRASQDYAELASTMAPESDNATILKESRTLGVEGEILARIGENMVAIVTGETDPLSLFTEQDLLWRLYADDASVRCYGFAIEYLRHLVFKDSNMAVLEIGAGTGGATEPILEALSSDTTFPFQSYDFTDVSAVFFERSKKRLQKWEGKITYRKLDLQEDALSQGFKEGSYDLVLASNVLHVAHSIDAALSRIQKLLKPGGRILMIETTRTVPFLNTAIGVLPGWWAAEDGRMDGPLLSEEQWDSALVRNGLGGAATVAKDFEGPAHRCAMIVSKPLEIQRLSDEDQVPLEILLPPSWENECPAFATELVSSLTAQGRTPTLASLKTISASPNKTYILLDNGTTPVLTSKDPSLFKSITGLLTSPISLLWVSVQQDSSSANNPEKGLVTGFARAARVENKLLRIMTLDVQDVLTDDQSRKLFAEVVGKFVKTMQTPDQTLSATDNDCIIKHGQLHIPRVLPDRELNHSVAKSMGTAPIERQPFHQNGRPLRLSLKETRILDKIEFEADNSIQGELPEDHLEVLVHAFGVNFKDVLIAGGHPKQKLEMAGEFAGYVSKVGAAYQGIFERGDRICGFGATPYASRVRVAAEAVAKVPYSLSMTTAASIPVVFATAYHALVDIARLDKGDSVLIHSAAGGVGQAAVSIAQWIGAEIFATVGNASKKKFLVKEFSIPEEHIFSSRLRTFKDGISRLTHGQGVDVVLNSLSGQMLQDSLACVAKFGTFVELGKSDIHSGSKVSMAAFDSSITVASVDLSLVNRYRPGKAGQLIQRALSLISADRLRIPTVTIHPLEDLNKALRSLQHRTHMGKIVLDAGEDAMVEGPAREDKVTIPENSTFIVVGGRSGIGFEIGKYLASTGARHIVLLSRRPVDSAEEDHVSGAFQNTNAEVKIISCDITDKKAIGTELVSCLKHLPPVRGVVQSSMVRGDRMLSNMNVEDFAVCTAPKVEGTQNLIKALEDHPLQFFVMLSSVVGGVLGILAESSYAAANAYLNRVANAYNKKNTRTRFVAVCPGIIEDAGVLTADEKGKKILQRQGFLTMKTSEIIAMVNYALSDKASGRECTGDCVRI